MEYHVEWAIRLEAENPRHAALQALEVQRNPDSGATAFAVKCPDGNVTIIDLDMGVELGPTSRDTWTRLLQKIRTAMEGAARRDR